MAFPFRRLFDDVGCVEIPVAGTTSNVYAVGSPAGAVLIDCGGAEAAGGVIESLSAAGFGPGRIDAIVVTHGHVDHFGGAAALVDWCGAPVWAHVAAAANIEHHWAAFISPGGWSPNTTRSAWRAFEQSAGAEVRVARLLREGDTIDLPAPRGGRLRVLHAPGHEAGELILFQDAGPRRRLAFVGDIIQGGMDASANWLGLFCDVAGQRRTLARLADLKPTWLLKGHRQGRSGDDVAADIASAQRRLDSIEQAVLEALADGPASPARLARLAFQRVLGMTVPDPANYAVASISAFLLDLGQRGLAVRDADHLWRRA